MVGLLTLLLMVAAAIVVIRLLKRSLHPSENTSEQEAAHVSLEQSPRAPSPTMALPDGAKFAAFVDVETTGFSVARDDVLELSIHLFAFSPETHRILGTIDSYSGLQEPSRRIPPMITAINGITDEMVRGKQLDTPRITAIAERAAFIVAHNASFDSKFVQKIVPVASLKPWLCSVRDVDWYREECENRKLGTLLQHYGIAAPVAHRAGADVVACLELLNRDGSDGRPFFSQIARKWLTSGNVIQKAPGHAAPRTMRRDDVMAELSELLKGILADGRVTTPEAMALSEQMHNYSRICNDWPINALCCRMNRILADGRIEDRELDELRDFLIQLAQPGAEARFAQYGIDLPYTQPVPTIVFHNRQFVLLGKFLFATKAVCQAEIAKRGGVCKSTVSGNTDVVVIGGRSQQTDLPRIMPKVKTALEHIHRGSHVLIVSEERWLECLLADVSAASVATS